MAKPWTCKKCGGKFGPGGRCPTCNPRRAGRSRATGSRRLRRSVSSALYSGWGFDDPVVAQAPAPVTTGEGSEELIDDLARESDLTCTLQEKWLAANPCLSPLASPWVSRLALLTEQLEAALQGAI